MVILKNKRDLENNTGGQNSLVDYFNGDLDGYKIGLKLPENGQWFVPASSFYIGALTLPLKRYIDLASIAGGTNNIRTDVDFALFIGKHWGVYGVDSEGTLKTKKMQSINFLLGASKSTLKGANTDGVTPKDTDVLSLDVGYSIFSFE